MRRRVDMSCHLTERLSGQHAKVVHDFARDPAVFRLPSHIAKQTCELFEAAREQARVYDVDDGHQELHSVGSRGTLVTPHRDRSNQQQLITLDECDPFPRARPLARHGCDLSDLATQAEGEEEPRQRQSQGGPQTDDAEVGGCSPARFKANGQTGKGTAKHADALEPYGLGRPPLPTVAHRWNRKFRSHRHHRSPLALPWVENGGVVATAL
jgi:hypothetical protein